MNDFQRYLVDEFAEDYQERRLSRRDALKLIVSVTGSIVVAEGILAACAPVPETGTPAAAASATSGSATSKSTATQEATGAAPVGTVSPEDRRWMRGRLNSRLVQIRCWVTWRART